MVASNRPILSLCGHVVVAPGIFNHEDVVIPLAEWDEYSPLDGGRQSASLRQSRNSPNSGTDLDHPARRQSRSLRLLALIHPIQSVGHNRPPRGAANAVGDCNMSGYV